MFTKMFHSMTLDLLLKIIFQIYITFSFKSDLINARLYVPDSNITSGTIGEYVSDIVFLEKQEKFAPFQRKLKESSVSIITKMMENEEGEATEHTPSFVKALQADYFQLKLYWQKGYFWQEETVERRWCAECEDSCKSGKRVVIQVCNEDDKKQRWILKNDKISPHTAKNLCMTFQNGRYITLRTCKSSRDKKQKFDLIKQFTGKVRDAYEFRSRSKCLTQHHHPKPNEVVYLQNCAKARRSDTSIWHFGGPWDGH